MHLQKGDIDMSIIALVPTVILFILGILGIVLPLLPGTILIWAGMLLYGILTGFAGLSFTFYLLQGLAVVLSWSIDYLATALGTRYSGGSKAATGGAVLGLVSGLIFLGPAGIIFGPFLGALAGELLRGIPAKQALRSSFGALIGIAGGLVLKLVIAVVMIVWFFMQIITV